MIYVFFVSSHTLAMHDASMHHTMHELNAPVYFNLSRPLSSELDPELIAACKKTIGVDRNYFGTLGLQLIFEIKSATIAIVITRPIVISISVISGVDLS